MTVDASLAVSVLIVEDHAMLAEELANYLWRAGVGTAAVCPTVTDDVLQAAARHRPALVLLDVDLGSDDVSAVCIVRAMMRQGVTVVLLTGSRDRLALARCLDAGACGIVRKTAGLDELLTAVRRALGGEPLAGRDERDRLIAELRAHQAEHQRLLDPFAQLSRREAAVLVALAEGRQVDEIATLHYVSVTTVRSQVRSILLKLGVRSQLAAVAAARRAGWLEHESSRAAERRHTA
jgi:two-component system nitrate/nitrite response regulator NarL